MAIDMTTVTAISYNNKDVVKIEDRLGRTLWQAGTPPTPTDEPIFVSASDVQQKLENNTFSSQTWTNLTNFQGNAIWSDGTDIYVGTKTTESTSGWYKLNPTTNTWSSFIPNRAINGNAIWSDYDGNIYSSWDTNQYKLNKTTGNWENITWTRADTGTTTYISRGSAIIKANNKIYILDGYSSSISEVDTTNFTLTSITVTNWPSNARGYNVWTDGTNYYYSNGSSNQYLLDFNNYSAIAVTWSGTSNFIGCRVIKYNGKIICQQTNSNNYWELDVATQTWSPYTFTFDSGASNVQNSFDKLWNYNGRWSGGCNCSAVSRKD